MARNNQRGSKNNNSEGRNQYSNGWMDTAKDRPVAAAAAAAAAVGAGVFLWSRRNQISEQISNLSDQVSDWAGSMQSGSSQGGNSDEFEFADGGTTSAASGSTTSNRSSGGKRGKNAGQAFAGTSGASRTGSAGTGNGGANSTGTGSTLGAAGGNSGGNDF